WRYHLTSITFVTSRHISFKPPATNTYCPLFLFPGKKGWHDLTTQVFPIDLSFTGSAPRPFRGYRQGKEVEKKGLFTEDRSGLRQYLFCRGRLATQLL